MFVVIVKAGISSILLRTIDCPLESNRVDNILAEGQQAIDIARLTEGFLKVLLNFPVSIQKILAVCIAGAHLCFHEALYYRIQEPKEKWMVAALLNNLCTSFPSIVLCHYAGQPVHIQDILLGQLVVGALHKPQLLSM